MRDALRVGLRPSDQRIQPRLQVRGRGLVETVVDLAGVDEIVALAATDVDAVPLALVECEAAMVSVSRCAQVFLTQLFPRPLA